MSDSDSDCDWRASEEDVRKEIAFLDDNITIMNPKAPLISPEEVFENWDQISEPDKLQSGHLMKVCAFWLPILLQRDEASTVTCWAAQVGLVEPYKDLNLRHVHKIEILEAVLRALVTGTLKKAQTKQMVCISNRFHMHSPEVLENALQWLERTGEPNIRHKVLEFGHLDICFKALHLIFVEFSQYIKAMSLSYEGTMTALTARPADILIRRSEEMKRKGNEHFQSRLYEEAVDFYSKALKYYPDNHIIYGNRALCYIKSRSFLKALGDGKRATLIKPSWAKGHYRYCEALYGLGEVRLALEANITALSLCKDDSEGLKDLQMLHFKFSVQVSPMPVHLQRVAAQGLNLGKMSSASSRSQSPKVKTEKKTTVKKEPEPKVEKKPGGANNKTNKTTTAAAQKEASESKPAKSAQKPAPKPVQETVQAKAETSTKPKEKPKSGQKKSTADVTKELVAAVGDGHAALENQRSRNAEQAFSRALALLDHGDYKVPGVNSIDVLLLQFGRATALTQIGRPEELTEAVQVLDTIQASEERTFQCLVCLGYGRVYVKENRYQTALPHFGDALKIVKNQITPGILTWPLTKHIVPETQVDYLIRVLEESLSLCRFPPPPDAVCRIDNCTGSVKKEIYFTDPDFKGFIQLHCSHSCSVEYHMSCWKTLKAQAFYEKSEKDFLQDPCLTPDCRGQINFIKIYGPTGLVKCKFEVAIPRPVAAKRPKVNQECTSLKKIKSKEERRLRRKQFKMMQDSETINTESAVDGEKSAKTPPRARLHFRDHVLLQMSQHLELLRQESSSCVAALSSSLRPWLLLDQSRGNSVASRLLESLEEPEVSLGAAVELLLERRNRVWARLFIHVLSDCVDLQPKVSVWAQRLDSAGLSAARFFMEQHSVELERLDLSLLVRFGPVEDIILEKLGSHPELFSSLGLTVTEYLRQSPPRDMRLFVWALDEHRSHYTTCHSILDHYFDMMDGLCSVLKKSEENIISSPNKSRNRAKKRKGPKPVLVLSGPQGGAVSDDWDPGLMEDDSLSFMDEPFSVPPHLRPQVASFEQQLMGNGIIYSNSVEEEQPDPSRDTLYGYFSQILEEHGPLSPDDPLLVEELKNFPQSTRRQIETAGGLEAFLLADPAFVLVGGCVALVQTGTLPPAANHSSLDELDFIDGVYSPVHQASFFSYLKETFPTLPCPDGYDLYTDPQLNPSSESGGGGGDGGNDPAEGTTTPPDHRGDGGRDMLSVAVNTEEIPAYEKHPGELNSLLKKQQNMRRQMNPSPVDTFKRQQQRSKQVTELEEELSSTTSSVQVTQKELTLFQHKLEEQVKNDQKEKKEHQEQLKALRQELDALYQERNRMKKSIKEKNAAYETRLRDFLEISNQSAAEKMSLEEELKRCKESVTKASRRSLAAQLTVLETGLEQRLYFLHRQLADERAVLHRLMDVAPRFPHQEIEAAQNNIRARIQEIEKKISTTKVNYDLQIKELKSGSQIPEARSRSQSGARSEDRSGARSEDRAPEQARAPEVNQAVPMSPSQTPVPGRTTPVKKKKNKKAAEVPPTTVFERAVERLTTIFPNVSRSELTGLIQKLRSSSGSLHTLSLQDVVSGVSQLILDQQEEQNMSRLNSSARGTPPLGSGASAWQQLEPQKSAQVDALNTEDPCIICHEDMSSEEMCVLECRHSFHRECIRSWLKEQSTCPTCRDHTLLPEDFPALPSVSTRRH